MYAINKLFCDKIDIIENLEGRCELFDALTKTYINFVLPDDPLSESSKRIAMSLLSKIHLFPSNTFDANVFSDYSFTLSVDQEAIIRSLHEYGFKDVSAESTDMALKKYLSILESIGFEHRHVEPNEMLRRIRKGKWNPV